MYSACVGLAWGTKYASQILIEQQVIFWYKPNAKPKEIMWNYGTVKNVAAQ